jgi:hypothetical protein
VPHNHGQDTWKGRNVSRRPATFRQSDLTRALKAALAAGIGVARVEIDPNGKIAVIAGEPSYINASEQLNGDAGKQNPWDEVLNGAT